MKVNNANINQGAFWNGEPVARRGEKVEFTSERPANADKFVLNLPTSEVVYKRQEFVTDESMGEGCAFCYTFMERTLLFEKGGITFMSGGSRDGYFVLNADKDDRTFGSSGAGLNDIGHAVEETWERIERSLEQTTVSGSLSGSVTSNGQTAGGFVGFAAQSTSYKYSSVRATKGTVAYKNGGIGAYLENAVSSREIYNKCAVFLAGAFGEKSSDLVLSEKAFNELFGKSEEEKAFPQKSEQRSENLENQLDRLKEFMERNLSAVRKKDPDCGSLKTFEDVYSKLAACKYSDIASLAEKIFAAGTDTNLLLKA